MIAFNLKSSRLTRFALSAIILSTSVVHLTACDQALNSLKTDREGNMNVQDYRDGLASRVDADLESAGFEDGNMIPELQPYIAQPNQKMKAMPLVSVSVNQTVPLRDILYELAEQAQYDLELDPRIRGAIIFTAREKPFDLVIKRISEIAGLRYKFEDDILRVEVDRPYNKLYKVDYLSYVRNMETEISSDVSVVSGDGADTGSAFQTRATTEANFWAELEANMSQVLGRAESISMATSATPRMTATAANPDVQAVGPSGEAYDAPEATINVSSLPLDEEEVTAGGGASGGENANGFTFSLNRQAGLINVYANERAHKEVQDYLNELKKSTTSQVLIEAKILEVELNDEHATGISWDTALGGVLGDVTGGFFGSGSALAAGDTGKGVFFGRAASTNGVFTGQRNFTIGYSGQDVDALIEALSGFGTVKALASPRVTTLNNQPAVLNVSTNRVFFEVDIEISNDGGGGNESQIDSEIKNVPEGVLVNVLPSIDLDKRTISMALRPTVTKVVGTKADPGVQFVTARFAVDDVVSEIPELNVQEIDTVVQMRSGQAIVMGGLLQDSVTATQEGIPVLGEIPVAGALFRTKNDLVSKTELVIFLKATILDNPGSSVHNTDKDLYRQFSSDRRPFNF